MEHDERNMLNFSDGQKINMTIPERIGKFLSCIEKLFFRRGGGGRGTTPICLCHFFLSICVCLSLCQFQVFELTHLTVE